MNWNDHDHRGEYAAEGHLHYASDIYDAAERHHDHAGTYSHSSHDHDLSDIWSYLTDLQNTVAELRRIVVRLQRESAVRP